MAEFALHRAEHQILVSNEAIEVVCSSGVPMAKLLLRYHKPFMADRSGFLTEAGLPLKPGSAVGDAAVRTLCVGLGEWLFLGQDPIERSQAARADIIRASDGDLSPLLVDITDGRLMLDVSGPRAADFLKSFVTAPFDTRDTADRDCFSTLFGSVACVLLADTDRRTYSVIVDVSYTDYMKGLIAKSTS
ncbi:MAG: hypothetical protein AAFR65_08340 [Pseudomonadota bacterium]